MSVARIHPGWFSIPGAARYTGFSETAIRKGIEEGRFVARRVVISGNGTKPSIRIAREDLDAWINGSPAAARNTPTPLDLRRVRD